jgi:membrane protein implicated in regulation of membrane protease activity
MKPMGCVIGAVLVIAAIVAAVFGFIFIVGSPASAGMAWFWAGSGVCLLLISLILIIIAAVVLIKTYRDANKPPKEREATGEQTTIVQKIDLTGDLSLEKMKCQSCGATLSKDSITTRAGAVVIDCPYCGTSYEIEEEPKW